MARTQAQDKYDAANMAYQTVKVKKETLNAFKAACAERGDKVNTVLRQAMENYIKEDNGPVINDLTLDDLTKIKAILESLVLDATKRADRIIIEVRDKVAAVWDSAVSQERFAGRQQ